MSYPQTGSPLAYTGVAANNPANVIQATRVPVNATDLNYPIGTLWVDTTNNSSYELTGFSAGAAVWALLGGGSSDVNTINNLAPTGGNITIAGTANKIGVSNLGSTVTLTIPDPTTLTTLNATTVNSTTFTTNVAAAELSISGTTIDATGSNAAVDLDITTKGAGAVIFSQSKAGVDQNIQITNSDNTAANSRAGLQLAVGGSTSTGDPYVNFLVSGAGQFTMGIDNSDSDNFKLSASAALGTSDVVTVTSAGAVTTAADITATTGNIVSTAGQVNAGTTMTAGTGITATTGNIQATNGNLVLNTAGNKIVSTSVGSGTAAGANSFGTTTLTGGTATVATTAVTASSIIMLTRQSPGATGVAALGILSVGTIVANTSFVINALTTADSTTPVATDVSIVGWMIIN